MYANLLLMSLMTSAPPPSVRPPECSTTLHALRDKLVANYAGYLLEIVGDRRRAHDTVLARLTRAAQDATDDNCRRVLAEYVAWFDDPHLFLFEPYTLDSIETARRAANTPRVELTEEAVRRIVSARGNAADPIEGVWYDLGMRIGVVPDPAGTPGRFVAVVLASDSVTLPVGAVHATIDRQADGRYHTALRWRSLAVTHPTATIYRGGTILRLAPAMWGRVWPAVTTEPDALDPDDVRRPTYRNMSGVPVWTIPSHQFQYKRVLDSLVVAHRDELAAAERMLVDLRGNEGGGSQMSAILDPYLFEEALAPGPNDFGRAVMLASPDQIRYASRAFGADTSEFVRRIVTAMEAAPGTLVPLFDPAKPVPTNPEVGRIFGPERVGVLVDRGTVSASEVMVQKAKRSKRAVVIGEATAGALDYQSTSIVRIHPDESRWFLGYPTITAHTALPKGGMRGKGIEPEVAVEWAPGIDAIAAALAGLR